MRKKVIFFDIDGTLITEDTQIIPESTILSLKKAKDNGHLLFINTGRTYCSIPNKINDLNFDGYICGCGTQIHYNDNVILEKDINQKKCFEIATMLRKYNINGIFEGKNSIYFDDKKPLTKELVDIKKMFMEQGIDVSKNWDDENLDFSKFVIWLNEKSDKSNFFNFIKDDFDYIDRGNNFFEIVPKGYSKATGIEFIQNHLNIELNDCFAIGDSSNDLPMLNYVTNSIVMGNGHPSLFDQASFVTKSIEDDGIEHALKYFEII